MKTAIQARDIEFNFEIPEPDLTPAEMIRRSTDLIPLLAAESAEGEELGRYTEAVHAAFEQAGLYRVLQPRMFGGYEFDIETFYQIVINIARGDPAAAWCYGFSVGHTIELASLFPEDVQAELYGPNGDFRAPYYGGVPNVGTKVEGGYNVKGKNPFCSGSPYSTHMIGQFAVPPEEAEATGKPARMFILPREEYMILDDWRGQVFGMSASGSNSIMVDTFVPERWTINETMVDFNVEGGTVGSRLHGNPMYAMKVIGYMGTYFACVAIGAAYAGLDCYEQDIRTRRVPINPAEFKMRKSGSEAAEKDAAVPFRYEEAEFQRHFGRALVEIEAARGIVLDVGRRLMRDAECNVAEGKYPEGSDGLLLAMGQTAAKMARDTFDHDLWRKVGAPATRPGTRMNRIYRDMAVIGNHNALGLIETSWLTVGKMALGVF